MPCSTHAGVRVCSSLAVLIVLCFGCFRETAWDALAKRFGQSSRPAGASVSLHRVAVISRGYPADTIQDGVMLTISEDGLYLEERLPIHPALLIPWAAIVSFEQNEKPLEHGVTLKLDRLDSLVIIEDNKTDLLPVLTRNCSPARQ